MKKIFLLFFVSIITLFSCSKLTDSYSVTNSGLEYKYREESNSGKYPKSGQKLLLRVKFYKQSDKPEHDTLLWDSREISSRFIMDFIAPTVKGATVNDAYAMMQEGDSISFLINAFQFYSAVDPKSQMLKRFTKDDKLRFEVRLVKIFSNQAFKNESEKIIKDLCQTEKELFADYISKNYPDARPSKSGLYIIETKKGFGRLINKNDEVAIHYKATYINGEPIYSTYKKNNPLVFKVNDSLVWPCLAETVQTMKKGGKSICIAPSFLAAGKYGDAKIPPCKSIIFEIELVAYK